MDAFLEILASTVGRRDCIINPKKSMFVWKSSWNHNFAKNAVAMQLTQRRSNSLLIHETLPLYNNTSLPNNLVQIERRNEPQQKSYLRWPVRFPTSDLYWTLPHVGYNIQRREFNVDLENMKLTMDFECRYVKIRQSISGFTGHYLGRATFPSMPRVRRPLLVSFHGTIWLSAHRLVKHGAKWVH